MKILFVSAVLPWPLHSGGQVRIYNLLKRLSKKYEITLVSFIRDESERGYEKNLSFCKQVHMVFRGRAIQAKYLIRAITSTYPWLLTTYDNTSMRGLVADILNREKYDLVHIEPYYVFPSLPKFSIPMVVGEHNVEYNIYEGYVQRFPVVPLRPLLSLDVVKQQRWEEKVWKKASSVTAVSEVDKDIIEKNTNARVSVVPNGVDLESFRFRTDRIKKNNPTLLYAGNFSWLPNVQGCKTLLSDIWPTLKNRIPGVSLKIVGKNLPKALKQRATTLGAMVVGEVTNIVEEYQSADILVAPIYIGGGTKFKILEAMASGTLVVTTRAGVQGLNVQAGVHFIEAETPEEFTKKIVTVWGNSTLRTNITKAARKLIENNYSWDAIANTLDSVWRETHEKHT